MPSVPGENERVRRLVLLHLLDHHGHQVRFEASQWATEFGILRRFPQEDPTELRNTLRSLETTRLVSQRTQYVVGYSEPKNVYSLTPSGHRQALAYRGQGSGGSRDDGPASPGKPPGRQVEEREGDRAAAATGPAG